jgi:hypothetical protein
MRCCSAAVREERGLRSEVRGESREEGRGGRLRVKNEE